MNSIAAAGRPQSHEVPAQPDAAAHERLAAGMTEAAAQVEAALDDLLPKPAGLHARAQEAMRYAVFAGGKRLRPFLILESAALFGAPVQGALRVAAAMESLHTYSLVHDDLPAMDDDDLRRGKPTVHRQFDEATAILAGDGLLTLAFELLADPATHPSGDIRAALVTTLARAAGSEGMIGGQMIDIEAPTRDLGPDQIIELQRKKTGALFEASCLAGAILGGAAPREQAALVAFARDFGLAFQISDDLIDVEGSAELAGKQVGKDAAQGKATLVSHWGAQQARDEAARLAMSARAALAPFGEAADRLRTLPFYLLNRRT
ncbi:MAG TPA: farnesyl diphosphate synthase [Phenylobacterium sp.]|uniref:polyprenyl synthetase family protein n=1 Tax=Phenylobacterium sp. TaxID=1871053 RepID=UPI002BAB6971|nr:farnesyl diphosphate synthase [Phenylobacterium sp.]HXA37515.1 farnesyl diphosphate synthase [Phenylobacterium sp.]